MSHRDAKRTRRSKARTLDFKHARQDKLILARIHERALLERIPTDGTSWPPPLTLKPRRKFDVPENPILVRFRKQKSRTARQFLAYTFEQGAALHRLYGLDALIHARRVIDKLS